ncbi:MAG: LamG domain-containing protein [Frankiaceae bacterium]
MTTNRHPVATAVTSACAAVTAVAALACSPAGAAATTTVGEWQLDERAGATVAQDSSGNGYSASIGSAVTRGIAGASGTAFRFAPPSADVSDPQRLVKVPDQAGLDPGTRDLHISLWVRTSYADDYNVMQKGQATTAGGFWKVQLDDGYPSCVLTGVSSSGARVSAGLTWATPVDDGAWHHILCEKLAGSVRLTIDDAAPMVTWKALGRISNTWPLVLGGKWSCAPDNGIDCDYYRGDLDQVVLSMG